MTCVFFYRHHPHPKRNKTPHSVILAGRRGSSGGNNKKNYYL